MSTQRRKDARREMFDEQEITIHRSQPLLIAIITTAAVLCVPYAAWVSFSVLPAALVVSVTVAVFSSGDSNAAVAGTYFVRHICPLVTGRYPKRPLLVIRWALVCAFLVSMVLALYAGNIVDSVIDFLSVTMSGLAVIILLGRFWKRATWQGGVAALTSAVVVSLLVIFVPGQAEFWVKPIIPATLASLIAEVVVSLMTPPNKLSFEEVTSVMMKQRQAIDN